MNKAITDGVLLMPPSFEDGLEVWSSQDGTPGSDTYANAANAAIVPADQDFGACLEIQKTSSTERLRYMGETPLLPGCYLRISAKVKAMSGNLPTVRIAGWAGSAQNNHVPGLTESGPEVTLTDYGEVIKVSAIVGNGDRGGVDMVWGAEPVYGHFGLDLTGPNGGVVRIEDFVIEDVTSVWLRDMLSTVDVRDFGAVGDGATDDSAAFEEANLAASGRTILVPQGIYHLAQDVTFDHPCKFEGTVTMPREAMLLLRRNFDLPAYIEAFEDEEEAFKRAFQALLNNVDHESLDLGGRKISVNAPIDMQAACPNKDQYATRRVIRNGQFEATGMTNWESTTVTSQASYSTSNARKLTGVTNIANVEPGSLVAGAGVGREIYVKSVNVPAQEIELNAPLYDAVGTQTFTFTRFRYLLDFSGFSKLSKFTLSDIEFQCNNRCSGVMLAPTGITFHMRDCFVSRPKDRGVTSSGSGCQGMLIERCQFLSSEDAKTVPERTSIAINSNESDLKLRDCRVTKFRHFAVLAGANAMVSGNHFFQGDNVPSGIRSAGIVMANGHASSYITNNYVDNCFIEWTNERDPEPAFSGGFSFSALSINDNIFLSGDVAPWFSYIVVKPHGAGHFLAGVSICGNRFRTINGTIDRVDRVDTSFADLDTSRYKEIEINGNSFHGINTDIRNPLRIKHDEPSPVETWVVETLGQLAFGGQTRTVESVLATTTIRNSNNVRRYIAPLAVPKQGPGNSEVHLRWGEDVKGGVTMLVRIDN